MFSLIVLNTIQGKRFHILSHNPQLYNYRAIMGQYVEDLRIRDRIYEELIIQGNYLRKGSQNVLEFDEVKEYTAGTILEMLQTYRAREHCILNKLSDLVWKDGIKFDDVQYRIDKDGNLLENNEKIAMSMKLLDMYWIVRPEQGQYYKSNNEPSIKVMKIMNPRKSLGSHEY